MHVRGIKDEVYQDYKKPSMLISVASCNFKCEHEGCCPIGSCQNSELMFQPLKNIDDIKIYNKYKNNPLTKAIVIGGLEPFDQFTELLNFITTIREQGCNDDIVIYSGYYPNEIQFDLSILAKIPNIIIKFGRYYSNKSSRYDEILGIKLASDNQFAMKADDAYEYAKENN